VLRHERNHSSVRSGVYTWIQNFERKVQHKTHSAHHEVRGIFFPSKHEIFWFHNQQMYNLYFLRHGNLTFTVFHFFVQFAAISYCTYNLNKNSKFYQQNLQAYINLFLYPLLKFPFESEFFYNL